MHAFCVLRMLLENGCITVSHSCLKQSNLQYLQLRACYEIGQDRDKKFFLEKCYFLLFGSFYYSLGGQKIDTLLLTYEQAVL